MEINHIKVHKEEFDTNREEILKAENIWGSKFPEEYVNFLLQYNGAVVYPNWPNLGSKNKTEIWGVERFFSIGDVILQKLYPMTYTLHDIDKENFEEYNLNPEKILVFAQGERGIYFFNLESEEHSHVYIENLSGGDGISKTSANSFSEFIGAFGIPEWDEEGLNENFEFSNEYHSGIKLMQWHMFYTPNEPELGFQRYKEVFEYFENISTTKDGHPNIIYKYVDDRLKLEYLLNKGFDTSSLLRGAKKAETIHYLVNELKLDINICDNGRYPPFLAQVLPSIDG